MNIYPFFCKRNQIGFIFLSRNIKPLYPINEKKSEFYANFLRKVMFMGGMVFFFAGSCYNYPICGPFWFGAARRGGII